MLVGLSVLRSRVQGHVEDAELEPFLG